MDWQDFEPGLIKTVFTDIDGTLTKGGRLPARSYQAIWDLHLQGIQVVPITGRPAGWCDMIARFWPVHGVVGENGALVYRFDGKKMHRHEFISREERPEHRAGLKKIAREVLALVPRARIASDQFCRRFDLAIDFAEDVHPALPDSDVQKIKKIFEQHGAHAKVSNIHVNGWFGEYDKLSACKWYCREWLKLDLAKNQSAVAYVGDSPNDEPMFAFFQNAIGVANVKTFLKQMKHHPSLITKKEEAEGFAEFAGKLLKTK